jgi:hypothetical protein
MKKALLAILLTASCSSGGGQQPPPKNAETEYENQIASALMFDVALLRAGDRVVYLVKREGENSQRYIWAAVGEESGAVWIENSVPFEASRMVVKTKFDRAGKMLEQWVGEPGGVPGQTYPRLQGAEKPKQVRDSSVAKSDSKEEPDRITVGGKPYDCTRVTTELSYPDGRKSKMINWFSREVPFAASKSLGGLVKRQFGRLAMELVSGDRNAKAELQIPPK